MAASSLVVELVIPKWAMWYAQGVVKHALSTGTELDTEKLADFVVKASRFKTVSQPNPGSARPTPPKAS